MKVKYQYTVVYCFLGFTMSAFKIRFEFKHGLKNTTKVFTLNIGTTLGHWSA